MPEIIPRWEWRTFTGDLGQAERNIRNHPEGKTRESAEVYILSDVSMDNTKVRDGMMDIKTLQQVNEDRLELWLPIMKGAFPLPAADIETVFRCFRVSLRDLRRDEYSFEQYLDELIRPSSLLKAVDVRKKRTGFTINGCTVEIADVTVGKTCVRTAAVEMEDPARVIATVRELGLDSFPNINYLRGLKNIVGMH